MAESTPQMMFDEHLAARFKETAVRAFTEHGDTLRSVGVFFDYNGALNDAQITKGIWMGPSGAVMSPDGVMGSAMACIRLLDMIMSRAFQLEEQVKTSLQKTLQETLTHLDHAPKGGQPDETVQNENKPEAEGQA